MTLTDEIREFTNHAYGRLPGGFIQTFRDLIDGLAEKRVGRHAPKAGESFPDFTLADDSGQQVRASELWQGRNLVIKFYRGGWCPYCNLELAAMQRYASRLAEQNAHVVAIAPEKKEFQAATKHTAGAEFRFLQDTNNTLAQSLGIAFDVDDQVRAVYAKLNLDLAHVNGEWVLPIPATFVVRGGVVGYSHVDPDYMKRQDPLVLLEVLRELNASPIGVSHHE